MSGGGERRQEGFKASGKIVVDEKNIGHSFPRAPGCRVWKRHLLAFRAPGQDRDGHFPKRGFAPIRVLAYQALPNPWSTGLAETRRRSLDSGLPARSGWKTVSPLATASIAGVREIADRFDHVLLDQWGVLHKGGSVFGAARDCVRRIRAAGK